MGTIIDHSGFKFQMPFSGVVKLASRVIDPQDKFPHFGSMENKKSNLQVLLTCDKCKMKLFPQFDVCKCWKAVN